MQANNIKKKYQHKIYLKSVKVTINHLIKSKINQVSSLFMFRNILVILIILLFPKCALSSIISEISLTIRGKGNQTILNSHTISNYPLKNEPTEIIINGVIQNYTGYIAINLTKIENNINIGWDYEIETCDSMFSNLHNIIKVDLSKFNNSKINNTENMFNNCTSLLSVNLTNFNNALLYMNNMFSNCKSLISIDLRDIKISTYSIENIFYGIDENLKLCFEEEEGNSMTNSIFYPLLQNYINNCSDTCFSKINTIKLTENKYCLLDCYEDVEYNFEFNGVCYKICPNGTYFLSSNKICIEGSCPDDFPFLDKSINRCYNLTEFANELINREGLNISNTIIDNNNIILNISNGNTKEYWDFDINIGECGNILKNHYNISTLIILQININSTYLGIPPIQYDVYYPSFGKLNLSLCAPEPFDPSILEIPPIIQNSYYNNFLLCDVSCEYIGYDIDKLKALCLCNESNVAGVTHSNFIDNDTIYKREEELKKKDDKTKFITTKLLDGVFDQVIKSLTYENKTDLMLIENDMIYKITTFENQKYNNKTIHRRLNLISNDQEFILREPSKIFFKECETELKTHYGINDTNTLVIFMTDYFEKGFLIPLTEYEIYNIKDKSKLNLDICKEKIIEIDHYVQESIEEKNIFKHNPYSDYYNDICYKYTTQKGTDITLNDRKNEFIINNMSLCEENCEFKEYKYNTKTAKCECKIKAKFHYLSEMIINSYILFNGFINIKKLTNLYILKCTYLLFTKEGFIKNYGSYILLFIIVLNIPLLIYFIMNLEKLIFKEINKILESNNNQIKSDKINNINNNKAKRASIKSNIKRRKSNSKNKKIKIESNPSKKKTKNNKKINIEKTGGGDISQKTLSKLELKNMKSISEKQKIDNNYVSVLNNNINLSKKDNIIKYNDYELNDLYYKDALLLDKRKFYQYYFDLLKRKNLVIFTFYVNYDYNIKIIKISLFSILFAINYASNALFFNDSTMHQIYIDMGVFNFIYQLPQIIYSTIITNLIIILMKFLSI